MIEIVKLNKLESQILLRHFLFCIDVNFNDAVLLQISIKEDAIKEYIHFSVNAHVVCVL